MATILGSSMAFIDGTVVNIALPALQATMGATIADVQWVVEAYTLFLAALMLTGGALATAGLGPLVYGLIESATLGLAHPRIVAALAAGFVLLAAFVAVEWRSASPMMPLELFRSTAFSGANAITLFLYAALAGCL